jgi:hypothetical protein
MTASIIPCLSSRLFQRAVRARADRLERNFKAAWDDLMEARDIAARHGMRLYVADCELEAGRIWLSDHAIHQDASVLPRAREALARAKGMLDEMGCGQRQPEYELAAARLAIVEGDLGAAREHLAAASPWVTPIEDGGKGFQCYKREWAELRRRTVT